MQKNVGVRFLQFKMCVFLQSDISNLPTENTELQILQAAYARNLTGLEKDFTSGEFKFTQRKCSHRFSDITVVYM